jgi:predicted RNase H-like HicB family nuclease
MKPYLGIVHKDADSCYGISFPDAPGCFSAADEPEELFAMATEALNLWLEGMLEAGFPVPPIRDIRSLRDDPDLEETFSDAAFVIAVLPTFDLGGEKKAA